MKAALYARVSTDKQDIQNQLPAIRLYAARQGYEIYKEYIDESVSGTKESRPAFDELLKDMRQNKFSIIIVTKLDRIGRSLKHILSLFDEFNRKGIGFVALDQNIDTGNAAGRLQMQILGAFAEFERNLISDRTKASRLNKPTWGKRGPDRRVRKKRGVSKKRIFYPQVEGV
jgi:DNA invertase Pin-like site-specific DNA recombinase